MGVAAVSWQRAAGSGQRAAGSGQRAAEQLAHDVAKAEPSLAERLAQDEAHLTGLAVVIRLAPEGQPQSVEGLANAITESYPHLRQISTRGASGGRTVFYGKDQTRLLPLPRRG